MFKKCLNNSVNKHLFSATIYSFKQRVIGNVESNQVLDVSAAITELQANFNRAHEKVFRVISH